MSKTQGKRTDPFYQAQDILSRRDHSIYEVRTKLRRKKFTNSQINDVISWLEKHKLVDDEQFAERYIRSAIRSKPVGPRWLQAKLQQKGVAAGVIEQALENIFTDTTEVELASQAAATWRRIHPQPASSPRADQAKHQQKLTRHLASRGFSYEAIESVVKT